MAEWKKLVVEGANLTTEGLLATEDTINVASDSLVFADESATGKLKRDTVVDIVAAVAGEGLTGQGDGTIDVTAPASQLTNAQSQSSTDVLLIFDGGVGGTLKHITLADVAAAAAEDTDTKYNINAADTSGGALLELTNDAGDATDTVSFTATTNGGLEITRTSDDIDFGIAASGVTSNFIADSNVTTQKINNLAVTEGKIANNAVTADKIAASAVDSSEIADGAVDTIHLSTDSVTADKIAASAVDSSEIADGAIDTVHLSDNSVTAAKIAASAVDSSEIADGAIDTQHIADSQVTSAKLADNIDIAGKLDVTSTGTFDADVIITGDLTVNGTTVTVNATNLNVEDQIILLNDGGGARDAAIVFEQDNVNNIGAAFGYSRNSGRLAFDATGAAGDDTGLATDAFISMVVRTDTTAFQKVGNIRVDSSDNIYIYVD